MKRSKHSLSHYNLSTFNMGALIPVGNFEVLPGDSVRMATSALLRVSPLLTPVMHPVAVRLHHWFVPYRVLWDQWEDFITGGPDGTGSADPLPTLNISNSPDWAKSIVGYMGVPIITGSNTLDINALPLRAYNLIWNEFYRDQDLQSELDIETNVEIQQVAWEKDQFTAARPWTQKGPAVSVPLGSTAPVIPTSSTAFPTFKTAAGAGRALEGDGTNNANFSGIMTNGDNAEWDDPDLLADLSAATAASVNDLRLAFALQRYQEARAQYGSRYTEYLRYLGVRSSDARLQRPEYLGGGKATISFSEVLRTGNQDDADPDAPIGQMAGHGISALRTRRWVRFFEEHGIVLTLASIRPRTMYVQGLFKHWNRTTKEDFWQKELELVGQEEVLNKEVYVDHATPGGVFGYQDRYYSYRHHPSYVTGDFRTTMTDWHLGRIFGSTPALNDSFVECVPSKRVHAVQTEDVLWGMFSHSIQARRLVGNQVIGRIM